MSSHLVRVKAYDSYCIVVEAEREWNVKAEYSRYKPNAWILDSLRQKSRAVNSEVYNDVDANWRSRITIKL